MALVVRSPAARAAETSGAALRVLLLDAPPALEQALRTALSPWGMQVDVHPSALDAAALSAHPERASALARANSAAALVWLEARDERRSLWLFDVSSSTSTSREVPAGTLDRALAAALALSIKTQLRGAATEPSSAPAAGEAQPGPAPAASNLPAPEAERDTRPAAPIDRHAPSWQLVTLALLRGGALEPDATETRFSAELRWAPEHAFRWDFAALWFGARVELGLARGIAGPSFQGEYSELGGAVSLGLSRRLSQLFSAGLSLSLALHSASLEGTVLPETALAPETRWGSALLVRPEMGLSFGAIGFVVQPALGAALRRQSFVVVNGGQEEQIGAPATDERLLETRPVWWMIGVGASLSVE